jgi:hypothetical protein
MRVREMSTGCLSNEERLCHSRGRSIKTGKFLKQFWTFNMEQRSSASRCPESEQLKQLALLVGKAGSSKFRNSYLRGSPSGQSLIAAHSLISKDGPFAPFILQLKFLK